MCMSFMTVLEVCSLTGMQQLTWAIKCEGQACISSATYTFGLGFDSLTFGVNLSCIAGHSSKKVPPSLHPMHIHIDSMGIMRYTRGRSQAMNYFQHIDVNIQDRPGMLLLRRLSHMLSKPYSSTTTATHCSGLVCVWNACFIPMIC